MNQWNVCILHILKIFMLALILNLKIKINLSFLLKTHLIEKINKVSVTITSITYVYTQN